MLDKLPGKAWADENGWELMSHAADYGSASYMKEWINVTIYANGSAELTAVDGLIHCKLGPFSFPHSKFDGFFLMMKNHCHYLNSFTNL